MRRSCSADHLVELIDDLARRRPRGGPAARRTGPAAPVPARRPARRAPLRRRRQPWRSRIEAAPSVPCVMVSASRLGRQGRAVTASSPAPVASRSGPRSARRRPRPVADADRERRWGRRASGTERQGRLHAVPVQLERRIRLPPDARSARRARRMLQDVLASSAPTAASRRRPDVVDTAVLLASELCENAVLHAGTEFERGRRPSTTTEVTVAVTDRGAGRWSCTWPSPASATAAPPPTAAGWRLIAAARRRLGHPPRRRRPPRDLVLRSPATAPPPSPQPAPAAPPDPTPRLVRRRAGPVAAARAARRSPTGSSPLELVAELVRRLRDVLDAARRGRGRRRGRRRRAPRELARAGAARPRRATRRARSALPLPRRRCAGDPACSARRRAARRRRART